MNKTAKVLVSNNALPTTAIGSWTTRLSRFITDNPNVFNYILSPNSNFETAIYCKKRSFVSWKKQVRKVQLLNWVALDYIKQLRHIGRYHSKLVVVVMDDPHLIEAVSLIKNTLNCEVELIFSFHGFELSLDPKIMTSIDKILGLSQYAVTQKNHKYSNYPKTEVIGNGVDSDLFFPLEPSEFIKNRIDKGYSETDEILIWMANDRPKKGFHIFKAVILELLKTHKKLKILTIGTTQIIEHPNVNTIGRLSHTEVASYLQLGNYYMFTTLYEEGFGLSMIEALKCGNVVMASNLGAIPDVLKGLKHTYVINEPESLNSWVDCFNMVRTNSNLESQRLSKLETDLIWNYQDWEVRFINALS